ncbi:type 2 lanthipeptide synthetase LanM family protein [Kitasatospora sp. NPDC089509]|uniref:type 2 lanthipeptide synthetase LanM family protein n=1 Tax=Kitasatospora sp. NPDC089509 TaxID=3364079 RepID=UPI00381E8981
MPAETPKAAPIAAAPWQRPDAAPLTGSWWARGLWLGERLAAAGAPPELADGTPAEGGPAWRAARRLARWRAAFPDHADDTAAAQAQVFGTDPELLHRLLAEHPDSLAARAAKPAWAVFVEEVMARAAQPVSVTADGHHRPHTRRDDTEGGWFRGFAAVVEPFLAEARRLVRSSPALADPAVRTVLDVEAVVRSLTGVLRDQLLQLLGRALVLELHVARLSDQLTGATAEERFRSFVALQCEPGRLAALFDEYAVLARLVAGATVDTAQAYAEFVARFVEDRPLLVDRMFGGADPGVLTEVRTGGGDAHEASRSVALLRFGSGARLVYKPRPLAIHEHFNEVVDWFNAALPGLGLRTVGVLDRGEYGWTEFVEPAGCADQAAAERFYHRQGALLALLYALAATDFHYENVIAVGDQPVAVDLESVLHADVLRLTGSPLVDGDPAQRMLAESVQRVGLLPTLLVGEGGVALDVGGMGGDKGTVLPFTSVAWEGRGTDEMRLARVRQTFAGSQNRPTLDGRDLDPASYLDALRAGFRAGYRAIADGREHLLAEGGPLDRFADDTARTIVRATRTYAQLLSESTHPDATRDALDRDRLLGLLFAQSVDDPAHWPLLREEAEDLWAGDVPLFRSTVGSRDLRTHRGTVLPAVLPESGLERARRIVSGMGERDLAVQDWIITAAFAARAAEQRPGGTAGLPGASAASVSATERPSAGSEPAGSGPARRGGSVAERALRQAGLVADRLADSAWSEGERVGWLGLDLAQDQWRVVGLRDDLYNGYPGIALFFAQLARVTGDDTYASRARRILAPFPAHLARRRGSIRTWGAFNGLTGLAYALDCTAELLGERAIAAPVPELLSAAGRAAGADGQLDVIGGAAGCLAVAEALASRYGGVAEDLAASCAAVLLRQAETQPDGLPGVVARRTPTAAGRPLLGMSHGVGGIGWVLLRHAARTGDAAALRTGRSALAHENAGFDDGIDNWPDHREQVPRPWQPAPDPRAVHHLHAWCHGAPGIGLLRAGLPAELRTPEDDRALRRAVRSAAAAGGVGNDSLCHGDLGNLELFAAAAAAGITEAGAAHRRACAAIVGRIEERGPVCGTPGGIATPGLMAGLAGVGHGLLRIAAPELVAPVLLLAPQGAGR